MTTSFQTGVVTVSPGDHPLFDLDETDLGNTTRALMEPKNQGTRISATRLIKSRDSSQDLVDQFVDLRMALEALFLRDFTYEHSQEVGFRLSLFGAWFWARISKTGDESAKFCGTPMMRHRQPCTLETSLSPTTVESF